MEPRRVEVRDEPMPARGEGELLVRATASAISQGTEMLLYRGEGPERFDPSLDASARTYPQRYGYCWVGEVVEGEGLPAGEQVFALASHATMHVLPVDRVRPIAKAVPATRAVLGANLETALTCTWDAEPALGERAVVLGGGVVGILVAWLLSRCGARVTLVERSARRRAAAQALIGAQVELCAALAPEGTSDLVVEATGDPANLDLAIACCAPEARIVVASFYGARRASLDLGDRFHRARLTLRSSQVSTVPPRMAARGWDHRRRWSLVASLLEEQALDALVAPPFPFERAADLYAELDRDDDLPPAHVFVYR
ncbi:MAG: NAD-binding protein [Deltaproteobacteria bacterium]|nr:NAD-binding protein [Deltaproteobacteria bacterium]